MTIEFRGNGVEEVGVVASVTQDHPHVRVGEVVVKVDPRYFRPTEVETLLGDARKAREELGWVPRTSFEELVSEMVQSDYQSARRDSLLKSAGFRAVDRHE